MAAFFAGDTVSERFDRIQTWREEAVSPGPGQHASVATQICVACITFYRRCLRTLQDASELSNANLTRLTRNYEALALWAHGYDIASGGLDEALLSSRRARRCYFESLTSICTTLLSRLLPLLQSLPKPQFHDSARSLKQTLDAGLVCLEDTYQDGDTIDSTSDTSSRAASDSMDEILKDLEVDIDCLLALDCLISCPADRAPERPQGSSSITWVPHQAICERIGKRFPLAEDNIVQRLGKATWNSFLRCNTLREDNERRDYHEESREPLDLHLTLPAKTVAASARSKDSGLGSSLPTSYAETIMSYRGRDGDSVKVPPLPKSAYGGLPFECLLCGGNVIATTNSAWKNHLFHDLRPYICVFEPCAQSDDPFDTRQEWVSHTVYHIIELNTQSNPADPVVMCPLCLEDMKGGHVKHLSAHLEEIALGAVALHADVDSDNDTEEMDDDDARLEERESGLGAKQCMCGKPASTSDVVVCGSGHCAYAYFHRACLDLEGVPDQPWICRYCKDNDSPIAIAGRTYNLPRVSASMGQETTGRKGANDPDDDSLASSFAGPSDSADREPSPDIPRRIEESVNLPRPPMPDAMRKVSNAQREKNRRKISILEDNDSTDDNWSTTHFAGDNAFYERDKCPVLGCWSARKGSRRFCADHTCQVKYCLQPVSDREICSGRFCLFHDTERVDEVNDSLRDEGSVHLDGHDHLVSPESSSSRKPPSRSEMVKLENILWGRPIRDRSPETELNSSELLIAEEGRYAEKSDAGPNVSSFQYLQRRRASLTVSDESEDEALSHQEKNRHRRVEMDEDGYLVTSEVPEDYVEKEGGGKLDEPPTPRLARNSKRDNLPPAVEGPVPTALGWKAVTSVPGIDTRDRSGTQSVADAVDVEVPPGGRGPMSRFTQQKAPGDGAKRQCYRCYRLKLRCDMNVPCTACVNDGVRCTPLVADASANATPAASSVPPTVEKAGSSMLPPSKDGVDSHEREKRVRASKPKVSTACDNCRKRRIKCDERRPSCNNCNSARKVCTGYPPPATARPAEALP